MRVLGLVPARGGSKGVPRKNIRPLGGRPLLAYTAESALAANHLERVVLSTDDAEIAEVGRAHGLEVPFMRPSDLARDDTPSLAVVAHALQELDPDRSTYDAVCLLQPTNPFRDPGLIDRCVTLFAESGADCVVTVLLVPAEHHPAWVFLGEPSVGLAPALGAGQLVARRQELSPAYHREGSVYVSSVSAILDGHSLYGDRVLGVEITGDTVNIDDEHDWHLAEARVSGTDTPRGQ